jgi:hypothetical protein
LIVLADHPGALVGWSQTYSILHLPPVNLLRVME